jgi:quinol monooxygenase YgiN
MGGSGDTGPFSSDSRVFALYRLCQTTERAPELLDALRSAAAPAFSGQGCVSSRVLFDSADPGVLLLLEEWESPVRLEAHLRSRAFHRVLSVLELSQSPPDVVYVLRGEVHGIEWLSDVLGQGAPARRTPAEGR